LLHNDIQSVAANNNNNNNNDDETMYEIKIHERNKENNVRWKCAFVLRSNALPHTDHRRGEMKGRRVVVVVVVVSPAQCGRDFCCSSPAPRDPASSNHQTHRLTAAAADRSDCLFSISQINKRKGMKNWWDNQSPADTHQIHTRYTPDTHQIHTRYTPDTH